MKTIRKALLTTKNILNIFVIFDSVLHSLIVFLIALGITSLFNISPWYAIIFGLSHIIINAYNKLNEFTYKEIESKVPELNYKITTAADNLEKDNEIVNELNKEVLQDMKKIKTSFFVSLPKVSKQLISIISLSLIVLILAQTNIAFLDISNLAADLQNIPGIVLRSDDKIIKEFPSTINETTWATNLSEILGEDTTITELGTQEIPIQIDPLASELDLSNIKDAEQKDFSSYSTNNIQAIGDVAYEEHISKKDQEIVKSYFEQMAKS